MQIHDAERLLQSDCCTFIVQAGLQSDFCSLIVAERLLLIHDADRVYVPIDFSSAAVIVKRHDIAD